MSASSEKPNIVVVGGSFVGSKAAELIGAEMYKTHRTILIERNTHFNNLFAFPRYAVVPKHEHRAFLPYTTMFAHLLPGAVSVHRGRVTEIQADRVVLEGEESIPYEYLVIATGTRLTPPGSMITDTKPEGIAYFQAHQQAVEKAQKIVIIGGGANGVQLATDIKDFYPDKSVTIVHPRPRLMHAFHPALHDIVSARCAELGIDVILNDRARIPPGGFPTDGSTFNVELASGKHIPADLAIMATGQTPNSAPLRPCCSPPLHCPIPLSDAEPSMRCC
ncbi:hypothetical protein EWM64_g1851 [Hericium alpestre]|uniref:FAD/NAD(P)-binding domain-containing protein n=1 Tax=Hericium alpestre TaxID=135208 RepID=A0A4Z0A537_9AGAM|nr:hypothetical protein EWM64_g1851 [Hericium alpestre]